MVNFRFGRGGSVFTWLNWEMGSGGVVPFMVNFRLLGVGVLVPEWLIWGMRIGWSVWWCTYVWVRLSEWLILRSRDWLMLGIVWIRSVVYCVPVYEHSSF